MRAPRTSVAVLLLAACGGGEAVAPDAPLPAFDAAPADAPAPAPDAPPARPTRLSETGLYADFAARTIAPGHEEFTPAYALWSDGAEKRRWLRLPGGLAIDKADPDHWQFPVGTRLFKEFARDGKRLETRLIERTGPGAMDYWMGAFVWNDDESEATFEPLGKENLRGTDHDAPSAELCWSCHGGEAGRVLGYSAVQLGATAPGPPAVAAALGYLHANCGHCHSDSGIARPDTDQILRLAVAETTPEATRIYGTTIGKVNSVYRDPEVFHRVLAGEPERSAVYTRLATRGDQRQMPPLATEHVDPDGAALIRAWISSL